MTEYVETYEAGWYTSGPETISIMEGGEVLWSGTVREFANAVQKLKAPDETLYRRTEQVAGPTLQVEYVEVTWP